MEAVKNQTTNIVRFRATGLVHEAYLKLVDDGSFATGSQFVRAAAQAMRRILIDHA